jgi:hypothetical protein
MEHTPECLKALAKVNAEIKAWETTWPAFCRDCNAQGMNAWTENQSPPGSGLYWPETLSELCETCYGKCPRCGADWTTEYTTDYELDKATGQQIECLACGWNWGMGKDDFRPADYECWGCHKDDYEEIDK